ncbi:unnamed protein product [Amoebophrya sp. A25]|nr:unnamed protein product [Amoebophrya sp. A25]|eukprot:GSA25T00002674001.1
MQGSGQWMRARALSPGDSPRNSTSESFGPQGGKSFNLLQQLRENKRQYSINYGTSTTGASTSTAGRLLVDPSSWIQQRGGPQAPGTSPATTTVVTQQRGGPQAPGTLSPATTTVITPGRSGRTLQQITTPLLSAPPGPDQFRSLRLGKLTPNSRTGTKMPQGATLLSSSSVGGLQTPLLKGGSAANEGVQKTDTPSISVDHIADQHTSAQDAARRIIESAGGFHNLKSSTGKKSSSSSLEKVSLKEVVVVSSPKASEDETNDGSTATCSTSGGQSAFVEEKTADGGITLTWTRGGGGGSSSSNSTTADTRTKGYIQSVGAKDAGGLVVEPPSKKTSSSTSSSSGTARSHGKKKELEVQREAHREIELASRGNSTALGSGLGSSSSCSSRSKPCCAEKSSTLSAPLLDKDNTPYREPDCMGTSSSSTTSRSNPDTTQEGVADQESMETRKSSSFSTENMLTVGQGDGGKGGGRSGSGPSGRHHTICCWNVPWKPFREYLTSSSEYGGWSRICCAGSCVTGPSKIAFIRTFSLSVLPLLFHLRFVLPCYMGGFGDYGVGSLSPCETFFGIDPQLYYDSSAMPATASAPDTSPGTENGASMLSSTLSLLVSRIPLAQQGSPEISSTTVAATSALSTAAEGDRANHVAVDSFASSSSSNPATLLSTPTEQGDIMARMMSFLASLDVEGYEEDYTKKFFWRFTAVLGVIVLVFEILTAFSNPGIVPRAPASQRTGRVLPPRLMMIRTCVIKQKWCPTCEIWRPPRSKHCAYCDNCVLRFDHHCTWLGNCIGLFNYRLYLICIYSTSLLLSTVLVTSFHVMKTTSEEKDFLMCLTNLDSLFLYMLYLFYLIAWCGVVLLAIYHTGICIYNLTTSEHVKNVDKVNPFDLGWEYNLRHVWCTPERLLPESEQAELCYEGIGDEQHETVSLD